MPGYTNTTQDGTYYKAYLDWGGRNILKIPP